MPGAAGTVGDILTSAVRGVLSRWTALRLAMSHGEARDPRGVADALLADALALALSGARAGPEAYALLFTDAFAQLGTDVEDGSIEEVAARLVVLHDAAVRGDLAPVRAAAERVESGTGAEESLFGGGGSESEDSDEDMGDVAEEATPPEPEVDGDGFTVVRRVTRSMTRATTGGARF